MIVSQKINVIRYTNGTLVKITPSADEFLSFDYDPVNPSAATYIPEKIYLEAVPEGDLKIAGWQYSFDGQEWSEITAQISGVSVTGNTLSIVPSCDLLIRGYLIVKAYADNPSYYDTVTLRRDVDATVVYDKANTAIEQTNRKIALIASEEQLVQFTEQQTMVNKMASIEEKADGIISRVTREYATMEYADDAAQDAENAANTATDNKLGDYYTKTETTTVIDQKADRITATVSQTYQTKAQAGTDLASAKKYAEDEADAAETAANQATDQKLANYVTTSQYSTLSQTVDGISTEVGKKVGTDEIISRINQSAEQVSIDAGKVNLNGAVIVERINDTTANVSIDADKIDLNGAVTANNYFKINTDGSFEALQGLIGAIHVIASAIYSGSHATPDSANDGFYLGADGSVSIGNDTNYVRWTKNQNNQFVLEIKVPSLSIGGTPAATTGDVSATLAAANQYTDTNHSTAMSAAEDAAKTATNYIYYDSTNGIILSETGTADGNASHPFNTQLRAGDIRFRSRSKVLMQLDGEAVRIYRGESKLGMLLSATGLYLMNSDGSTIAASITNNGLFVRSGQIGGFEVTSSNNTGTTAAGGHLYKDSLFIHTSDNNYEYEFGIHGIASKTASGLYVARIDKGGSWSTSNATLLTHLVNDGTLTTKKAVIGGWNITQNAITANKIVLDSKNNQIAMGAYSKDSASTVRTKAYINEDGYSSFKGICVDEFCVGDDYPWNLTAGGGWNTLAANRSGIYFSNLYAKSDGIPVVLDRYDGGRVCYSSASSIRYKDVDRSMTNEDVQDAFKLQPVIAKYKEGYLAEEDRMNGKYMPMFIAEEVAKTIPEAVIYNGEDQVEDWNYRVIIPVQHQMILAQQKRINKLEDELADIKKLLKEVLNANK